MNAHRQCWLWRDEGRLGPFAPENLWEFARRGQLRGSEMVIEQGRQPLPIEDWFAQESARESAPEITPESVSAIPPQLAQTPQQIPSQALPQPIQAFPEQTQPSDPHRHPAPEAEIRPKPRKPAPEVLLWEGRRASRSQALPWVLILCGLSPAALQFLGWVEIAPLWWLSGIFLSLLFFSYLQFWQGASLYRLTSQRLILKRGRILSSTQEMHLGDVRSISCLREGWGKFLGLGTLEMRSGADGGLIVFKNLSKPRKIERLIRKSQKRVNLTRTKA